MSDLIERLRDIWGTALGKEAANEIESLRAKVAELEQDVQTTADALGHTNLELTESRSNDLYAMKLNAELRAMLREIVEAWDGGEHFSYTGWIEKARELIK